MISVHIRSTRDETLYSEGKAPTTWAELVCDRRTDFYFRCLVRPLVEFFNSSPGHCCVLFLGIRDPQTNVHLPALTEAQRVVGVHGATHALVDAEIQWILTNLIVGNVSMDDIVIDLVATPNPMAPEVRIYIRSVCDRPHPLKTVAYVENNGTLRTAVRANRLDAYRRGEMDPESICSSLCLQGSDTFWVQATEHNPNPIGLVSVAPQLVARGDARLDQVDCQAFRRGNCMASAQCTLRHCEASKECIVECMAFRAGTCTGCTLLHTGAPVPGAVRRPRGGRRRRRTAVPAVPAAVPAAACHLK